MQLRAGKSQIKRRCIRCFCYLCLQAEFELRPLCSHVQDSCGCVPGCLHLLWVSTSHKILMICPDGSGVNLGVPGVRNRIAPLGSAAGICLCWSSRLLSGHWKMLWNKTSVWCGCKVLTFVWMVSGLVLGTDTDQLETVLMTCLETYREMRG